MREKLAMVAGAIVAVAFVLMMAAPGMPEPYAKLAISMGGGVMLIAVAGGGAIAGKAFYRDFIKTP